MSGWTKEKRQAARNRIYQNRPWLKSTGARTIEGKAISSQNACKNVNNVRVSILLQEINYWIMKQKSQVDQIKNEVSNALKHQET